MAQAARSSRSARPDGGQMDRRGFVTLAGGLLAAPVIITAQTVAKVYQLGAFHVGDHVLPALRTLTAGLAVKGYEKERTFG